MKICILSLVSFIFFMASCNGGKIDPQSIKLSDYTFETTPNNLTDVGYVFALKNKMQIPVTMLDLQPKQGVIVVPTNSSTKDVSLGAIIKFLGLPNLNATASAGLNNQTKVTTTFSLDNPKLSRAFLTSLDTALTAQKVSLRSALTSQNLQNADLYVVFEAIKTNKMTYDFSKSKIGSATLNGVFKEIASTNDSIKWNKSGSGSLTYELNKDLTIFYKVVKINVLPGAAGMDFKHGAVVTSPELIYTSR